MSQNIVKGLEAFLTGGIIIGGAKYISTKVSAVWAALLGGAPTGIISAFFLKNSEEIKKFYYGYFIQSVVLIFLLIILNILIKTTNVPINVLASGIIILWLIIIPLKVILKLYTPEGKFIISTSLAFS